ncbi:hypothetical protein Trydic_g20210 [Trypoxylus dichotomus]
MPHDNLKRWYLNDAFGGKDRSNGGTTSREELIAADCRAVVVAAEAETEVEATVVVVVLAKLMQAVHGRRRQASTHVVPMVTARSLQRGIAGIGWRVAGTQRSLRIFPQVRSGLQRSSELAPVRRSTGDVYAKRVA